MGGTIIQALTIIGSLGLFLYGMKLMSEALQKVAGNKLRDILAAMTSNTFKRILVGALITAVIQSSSATTVMIISFVNAGLLSLVQSIGLIMGANIGTTSTAWLISLFGFKFDLGMAALPLFAIGLPLMFPKGNRTKSIGEFIIGFSILFMGLNLLKESMSGLQEDPAILSFLANFSDNGFASVLLFVLIGTVLTILIQSSSATMALTIIMCNNGWINFDCAAAMVLGENIGTTITANIASLVANSEAQKAARAHFIFNIIGVIWMLALFPVFIKMIVGIVELFGGSSPVDNPTARPIALALYHTLFNIINTFILVWFTPQIAKLSAKLVRTKETPASRLTHMESGMLSTSELSIVQAYSELTVYSKRSSKMFGFVKNLFKETNQDEFDRIYQRIEKYEAISDTIESEIYNYLTQATRNDMGSESFKRIETLFKVISDIETMSDRNFRLARIIRNKRDNGIWFNQELRDNVNKMFEMVDVAIELMNRNLNAIMEGKKTCLNDVYEIEDRINKLEYSLKEKYVYKVNERDFKYSSGVVFAEIISETERLADTVKKVSTHMMNIAPHTKPE